MAPDRARDAGGPPDPLWYQDAIIYELHVRAFQDSTADGIGDFRGLTSRLPYLQDLGVTALWLLPFYPSPLRDDGYDIADYMTVHPDYGTLDDFRRFLDEAHRHGMRVITELVVNHTSDQHPWFQRARLAPPGSPERDYYVWSDTPEQYQGARVIFQDFELSNWTWDPVAEAYYWHRFYSHQPDLNFDNPRVFDAVQDVLDFWFGLGVDGMRLDAVPYLVEREGTSSENLRPTHELLKRFRRRVDEKFPNRMFIAEANQWPEDAVAYFGDGDESHMVFHFPLMPRLFMAIRQEDRLPIVDILAQTPAAPDGCQWALFLRNHDELTLEMVTEEERLYMYHVYASEPRARINLGIRRRLAPLLGNSRRRIELMNALLFSLPGTPVLYYGDEIGMGDNIYLGDRNGVRTPMQWSGGRNAGFSDAPPQSLYLPLIIDDEYHHQSVHVEQQVGRGDSLLGWMKQLIRIRKRHQVFGRGDLELVDCSNTRVLAFLRRWRGEDVLVVANLSRFIQHAELHLPRHAGAVPVELFGMSDLPRIGEAPYPITLGPHGFAWCRLSRADEGAGAAAPQLPRLRLERDVAELFEQPTQRAFEDALAPYLERSVARWFGREPRVLDVRLQEALPVATEDRPRYLLLVRAAFRSGEPEHVLLPVGVLPANTPDGDHLIAELCFGEPESTGLLYDAAADVPLSRWLWQLAERQDSIDGRAGTLRALLDGEGAAGRASAARALSPPADGPNVLMALGRQAVLKILRRVEPGPSPEIEVSRWLGARGFRHAPRLVGSLHYEFADQRGGGAHPVGVLKTYVEHEEDAKTRAERELAGFLAAADRAGEVAEDAASRIPRVDASLTGHPLDAAVGPYLEVAARLGRRTADLHRALAGGPDEPEFAPEPFTPFTQRSEYQRMRSTAVTAIERLRLAQDRLEETDRRAARALVEARESITAPFEWLLRQRVDAARIRVHGNYHLGQVLHAGSDLVIVDFDGEPARPLYERRLKRSPLQDVAAMVRSFHYAALQATSALVPASEAERFARLAGWARAWRNRVSEVFVASYVAAIADAGLLPADGKVRQALFNAYLVERAFYEVGFELSRRRPAVAIPLMDLPLLLNP